MLISKNHLRARHSVSKDDSRPLLTIIDITKDGDDVVAAATDGYMLIEVRESTPSSDEFPDINDSGSIDHVRIKGTTATKMKMMMKDDTSLPILGYGNVTESGVVTTNLERSTVFNDRQVEGKYPDYKLFIPEADAAKAVLNVNPRYLASILKAFDDADFVTIELHGALKPLVVRSSKETVRITGVVMPLKV